MPLERSQFLDFGVSAAYGGFVKMRYKMVTNLLFSGYRSLPIQKQLSTAAWLILFHLYCVEKLWQLLTSFSISLQAIPGC